MRTANRRSSHASATRQLAEFVSSLEYGDIPPDVLEYAKLVLLDGLGCAIVASELDWSQRAVQTIVSLEGSGECVVWGHSHRVPPTAAALLNGTLVQGMELDDYHPTGPLHSAACVVPAVLALAEQTKGVTGREFLTSLVTGFEIGPRVGIASGGLRLVELGYHCGSVYGSVAAAAGAARLMRLTSSACSDALGIGATQAAGLMGAQFGAMVKRMHSGRAAQTGIYAAALAARGYTGIADVFDIDYGGFSTYSQGRPLDRLALTGELGSRWEVSQIAIKPPYACMGGLHSSLDAIKDLRADGKLLAIDEIMSIDVGLSTPMFRHAGWPYDPAVGVMGAQMNAQYAIARMLGDGDMFIEQFTPDKVAATDIGALIERIRPYADSRIDELGSAARWGVHLTIRTSAGDLVEREVLHPLGSPQRPLAPADVVEKFFKMTASRMSKRSADDIKKLVDALEDVPDVARLAQALATSHDQTRELRT
jgi:aconitate decarboxylase